MCFNIVVSLGSSGFQGYIALHHAFFAHKNIGGELRQRNVASRGVAQDETGGLIRGGGGGGGIKHPRIFYPNVDLLSQ